MPRFLPRPLEQAPEHARALHPVLEPEEESPRTSPLPLVEPSGPPDPSALLPWMDDFSPVMADSRMTQHDKDVADWRVVSRFSPRQSVGLDHVVVPPSIMKGLDTAWATTQRTGKEAGGNIVRDGDDYSTVDAGYSESDEGIWVDEKQTGGKDFVGGYHTHPLASNSTQNNTFSPEDLTTLLSEDHKIEMLRSGNTTRMVARTKEFEEIMHKADNLDDLAEEMREDYEASYLAALGGDSKRGEDVREHERALEAAVLATATKYHLMYFSGQGPVLQRRDGRPQAPPFPPPPPKVTEVPPVIVR